MTSDSTSGDLSSTVRVWVGESLLSSAFGGQSFKSPLPDYLEKLAVPVNTTEQSRPYVLSLPQEGMVQVANAINMFVDSRELPVKLVRLLVHVDPESGRDELVASLDVMLPPDEALSGWESLEKTLQVRRAELDAETRRTMDKNFALEVLWLDKE